ncbi:cellulose synthase/poly-beta-1,6-N-acetylglucosamine synthase-like glycosyltransferase/phosphoglycerol transferase MdoB-like AlkP superfamily enzyme [Chryseobacterium bernardetii]|uniref:Cellulose synthase/poly-beta-1,6-N-acetylglucosamine synthase-like glycosyltransferase n=2 Tax=Chryseobacterium TaxID=59732 RepID=A0A543EJB8_9FLAO|nr:MULTISPECIES: sulfatase-like hydrolase/transferase [Chryseobacterium]MDR6370103.1 cellulose synthase/poly-beta-1,6-N-acetylglucosamine synthase-like glycosyltransferase/phosphoglycerol transferase MdoB-like AlkP superfamily enzyme [Chryseobacterium vietnamense]MDR6440654.1 cellulose synthase/poly-beta-1,6-N-acetylglucosamine synthase-like glycosyltransferase/phosphoglycerol transferase MdoB-like AlkP superfamily enzyme [Chryseobacterium bernardetii]TQM21663.1 cellulose synthase/poly-beta-1,6-
MLEFSHIIYEVVIWLFLVYGTAVTLIYGWIGIYALGAVLRYKKENTFTDYSIIAANPNAPVFSVIAPAYNEGMTIVENVRSLLSLYYHNLEIIIVNDGSKDDSIQKLIEAYELESVAYFIQGKIETNAVRGVYKSKNPAFKKLIVVDKENGGKADALNVGVNISSGEYLVCIDVDCILEQDSILKLAKPMLEQTDKKFIACGGVIRLANNCVIENGKVVSVNMPKTLLGRTQALEYIRAFVLGRMAWSRASGLILISGAFGVFDRKIVLACGGYDKNTVGEDMELVVRMRKYMEERNEPYEVLTIPDPLCWTEVPESKDILRKQRNRWMRGTMETLWKHRKMMFNPKYKKLGMISLPYWFFFEFLGPLIEFSGYIIFILFLLLGIINWPFFTILFALVISMGFLYSIYAILVDLVSHQVYTKRKDFLRLIVTAFSEPFYFHPIVVKAGVNGFIDYFKKSHGWGEMTRQGFNQSTQHLPLKERIYAILQAGLKKWGILALAFFALFLIGVTAESLWYHYTFPTFKTSAIIGRLFVENILFALQLTFCVGIIYLVINFIKEGWARILGMLTLVIVAVTQYILFLYFSESRNILGADLLYYSKEEMKQILQASGMLNFKNFALLGILITASFVPIWIAGRTALKSIYPGLVIFVFGLAAFFIPSNIMGAKILSSESEFNQNAAKSKWAYFFKSNEENFISDHPELAELLNENEDFTTNAEMINKNFPFWRKENTQDFLGSYINRSEKIPNLVFLVMEGFGHAYTSPKGYIGNFTPYLDSLSNKGLYWENSLSSAGRTFGALPSLTGSLPFGKNGFLEIEKTPENFNLYNILKANGFETGFYYGGHVSFDRYREFLEYSGVDHIVDEASFSSPYRKLPANNGESWGYEDQAVLDKMQQQQKLQNRPYFNMILTLSTHNPFLINNKGYYEKLYNQRLNSGTLTSGQKKWAAAHKDQLISVLNADDALKGFFENYSKRPDFKNTIFVITGDHSMPEITLESKIDRFHVPLLIYSPLLKESKRFHKTVSHFDIAPSILAYYRNNYKIHTPSTVTWVGRGFSADSEISKAGIPMMQSKNQLIDFVSEKYYIHDGQLFTLKDMEENAYNDAATMSKINGRFNQYKSMNAQFYSTKKLMPDSVMVNFKKKTKSKF